MTLSEKFNCLCEDVYERWRQLPPFDLTTHPEVVEEYGDDLGEFYFDCPSDHTTDRKGVYLITFAAVGKTEDGDVIAHLTGEEEGQIENIIASHIDLYCLIGLIEMYEQYYQNEQK